MNRTKNKTKKGGWVKKIYKNRKRQKEKKGGHREAAKKRWKNFNTRGTQRVTAHGKTTVLSGGGQEQKSKDP